MKILITGGAGFIGQHLARLLVTKGHEVTAMDSLDTQVHQNPEHSAERFPGVVLNRDVSESDAWESVPPHEAIVHLAAETGTSQSMYEQDHYRRVNVGGTQLAATTAANWMVPIVTMSSRAVYGEGRLLEAGEVLPRGLDGGPSGRLLPSNEEDPHGPVSVYGETKSAGETALERIVYGRVSATIIRPQNVIGQGQALHNPYTGVLAAFLARLKEGRELSIYGDGSQTRDFVHVEDLAALVAWCLENPSAVGEPARVLNCGTGVRTSLDQLAQYAIDAAPGTDVGIVHTPIKRAGDIDHACADLRRLKEIGAPLPAWSTKEAITQFIKTSWSSNGADSSAWDQALKELANKGLVE
ncbi:NAD-dependent epimerase/dehydratase family protein [Arthrobacter sp. MMS18-M83]|uniref:NAD-dependent epimerase/dehydratase family protein n=1 Tax=Arthrobacter sp. MMS18-M83 TaxID=2996261 RepID=UPI00227B9CA0|nr:NAD-dependent epimerase/dehydratase family protein [Arthrobacter sp. MMS18-M83]WAH95911.1 NAD-dependent epimerase/dehydratase family protein [Arthrobacter sp. MMS18-M83]